MHRFLSIRWRIALPFLLLTSLLAAGLTFLAIRQLRGLPLQNASPELAAQVDRAARTLGILGLVGGALAILITLALAALLAADLARPLRRLTRMAEELIQEEPGPTAPPPGDEIAQLTLAFNRLVAVSQGRMDRLAQKESRMAAVLDHLRDGILILDEAGRVQRANPALSRLLQQPGPVTPGASFPRVVRDHRMVELLEECQEENALQSELLEMRDGRALRVTVAPFWDGFRKGYLVVLRDLTKRQQLERIRKDFISNVSHELRTPLASLRALVETLRDGALEDPPAARRFLDRIETEVDALAQMVQELLELSRIESRQAPFHWTATPVSEIVLGPVERLQTQAARAGIALVVDLPARLPRVLADRERVQQVITNLVHNAIKFTPSGGQIRVSAYVQEGDPGPGEASSAGGQPVTARSAGSQSARIQSVVIQVADTGVGIPGEDLPRIFERFYRADRARSGQGTGLGLAIAKHIVQAHGGRIWAESQEGKGATISFSLPVAREDEGENGREV